MAENNESFRDEMSKLAQITELIGESDLLSDDMEIVIHHSEEKYKEIL